MSTSIYEHPTGSGDPAGAPLDVTASVPPLIRYVPKPLLTPAFIDEKPKFRFPTLLTITLPAV